MGGHHHHDPDGEGAELHIPASTNRWLIGIAGVLALLTVIGMVALWPSGEGAREVRASLQGAFDAPLTAELVDARLDAIEAIPCPGGGEAGGMQVQCVVLTVIPIEGPNDGEAIAIQDYDAARANYEVGETLVLSFNESADFGFQYSIADRQRSPVLIALAALFAVAVVILGRLRGLAALVGLVLSFVILLQFTVPALLDGRPPVGVAVVTASAVAFCAIYLAHGINTMSTVALLGTLSSLALTTFLAVVFTGLARINLLFSEEAAFLRMGEATVDLRGLFLAGIIIGTLGALDDMTVTQASAVWELRAARPTMGIRELYLAGLRIGRDHVASTVNTLVLAYAGASMPLLLLFAVYDQSLLDVANGEIVAAEIVRTLVGSIGLVAAVPLTTWLAAVTVVRGPEDAWSRPD